MTPLEYLQHDALGLAALVRSGAVSSRELMECAIRLARERGPMINAICHPEYDAALAWASDWQPRGAFQGIPFLLKDAGLPSKRLASSIGSKLFANMRFALNGTLFERFENAGLLPFARTTVPELCMAPTTEAVANGGPTRNPWDLARSTGGSSGGAAAAVAAGIVPLAHATDGGGSIRIPASCCGVYGLKSSRGLIPMGPLRGEGWGGLAADGVVSRTVRDTAAVLDEVAGMEIGAPYAAPPRNGSYLEAIARGPERALRIGVWRQAFNGLPVAAEPMAGLERAAQLCRERGHELVDVATPDLDYDGFIKALTEVMAANIKVASDARLAVLRRGLQPDDLEPAMLDGYAIGARLSAAEYVASIQRFHAIGRVFANTLLPLDLMLSPALTTLPAPLGSLSMRGPSFAEFRRAVGRYTPFLAVINAAGLPAACQPVDWTPHGVPVACQVIGPFGREDRVLQLSAQLEEAAPWAHRRPAIFEPASSTAAA